MQNNALPLDTNASPQYTRLMSSVNPKDRIRFDDLKDNQLHWVFHQPNIDIHIARFTTHPENPYQVIRKVCGVHSRNSPYGYFENYLSFIGKDKLFYGKYFVTTDASILLMKLEYEFTIPGEITPEEVMAAINRQKGIK